MSPFHASNNWLCVELEHILNVWLNCLEQEESLEPETESQVSDTNLHEIAALILERDDDLPGCLCYSTAEEAQLATAIRKQLIANLDKEQAMYVLAKLAYKTVKQSGTMKRIYSNERKHVSHLM